MAMRPRGPAAAATDEAEKQTELPLSLTVTYMPGDGDHAVTKWHGLAFEANVPKEIKNPDQIKHFLENSNPFFKVGEFVPGRDKPPAPGFNGIPTTPEQYRGHFVNWFNKIKVANREGEPNANAFDELMDKWLADENLRRICDVGVDDYDWIGTLFLPKMHELARANGMNDKAVEDKWKSRGVFMLPFHA